MLENLLQLPFAQLLSIEGEQPITREQYIRGCSIGYHASNNIPWAHLQSNRTIAALDCHGKLIARVRH